MSSAKWVGGRAEVGRWLNACRHAIAHDRPSLSGREAH